MFIRTLQFDDKFNNLWIGATEGLFFFHLDNNTIEEIYIPVIKNQLKEIFKIFRDDDGLLWVGTYSSGVFIVDPVTRTTSHLKLEPYADRTETVRAISKSVSGYYWIGTRGGLYVYSKENGVTGFLMHDERDTRSLANNSIISIYHDIQGGVWVGSRGGLNLLSKRKQVFRSFRALPGDNHFLNCGIIYAFWVDEKNRIWVGTEDGGINIYDPENGTFEYLTHDIKNPNSISENCIKAFLDDGQGNLWIGTFWGGIDVLNLKTGEMIHYRHSPEDPYSLSDNRVWALCRDNNYSSFAVKKRC